MSRAARSPRDNGTVCGDDRAAMKGKLLAVLALLTVAPARAQDSQYWDIQYGPVAQLLGGLVVGSSRDLSATYYNPGGLALGTDSDFLLSAQAFKAELVTINPVVAGQDLKKSQSQFDAFPQFFAFSLPKSWHGDNTRLAFSLLTRQQFNIHIDQRLAGDTSASPGRYGLETLFDQRMSEIWGGLTLSQHLTKRLGLGATFYGIYRNQRTRREQSIQATYEDGRGVSALGVTDFKYSHWSMLGKIGLAWEGDSFRLGGAITTPRLGVAGSGNAGFTRAVTGADLDGDGKVDSLLLNGFNDGLDSEYASPWAFSGGASWRRGSLQFHASAEYFARLPDSTVLPSLSQDSAGNRVALIEQHAGVFNAGAGAEYWLGGVTSDKGAASGGTVIYAAFATDFTSSPDILRNEAASSNMDLFHISGGAAFSLGSSRFSVGASWAFGKKMREFDFSGLPPGVPIIGEGYSMQTKYSRVVFVLGYLFGSKK
jgi:hypothetical protein